MRYHIQLNGSAQVRSNDRSPPNALFSSHQQCASYEDPHQWRCRTQLLSIETFNNLQVPYDHLQPTKPFSGVTGGSTVPIGQVRLPVTFKQRNNYRTELIDFDIAHIRLPYNAILGYPALAKFMAVTHHGYNVVKMPGSGGVITVPYEERDAVCSLECAFQATAIEDPDHRSGRLPEAVPKKKKTSLGPNPPEAGPSGSAPVQGAPSRLR